MKLLFLLAFTLPLGAQEPNLPKVFPVAGRVVEALSAVPVAGIRMVIALEAQPQTPLAVTLSDEQGRFQFRVPAGRYQLRAERLGLPPQLYLQGALNLPSGSALVVGGKEALNQLTFRLLLPSVISGKVVDEEGEPVDAAEVSLIERRVVNGLRYDAIVKIGATDDRGVFRFGNLSSGIYSLAIIGKPWYAGKSTTLLDTFLPLFYPEAEGMSPIVLGAGATVDLALKMRGTGSVSLETTIPRGEAKIRVIEQDLVLRNPEGVRLSVSSGKGYVDRITLASLPAGEYESTIVTREGDKVAYALEKVNVNAQPTRLAAEPRPSPLLTVRVVGEPRLPTVVTVTHFVTGEVRSVAVPASGLVEVPDLAPGLLRFAVSGPEAYLATLVHGEGPLVDGRFLLEQTPVLLEARVRWDTGKLRGIVRQDGRASAGVLVALVPLDQPSDAQRYRSYQTDSDGSYSLDHLPPGEYALIVSENLRLEFADAKLITALLKKATPVRIAPKSENLLDLEAKP